MTKTKKLPSHTLTIRKYHELRRFAKGYAEDVYDLLVVVSSGGQGKSEMFARMLDKYVGTGRYGLIKGRHTNLDLYKKLFEHRERLIVFDDLDGLLQSKGNVSLLKCVADTTDVKIVEYGSTHAAFRDPEDPLPTTFHSKSKVAILCNNIGSINPDVHALMDRGIVVHFDPSALEVHKEIARGGWFDDEEVFRFIGDHLPLIRYPGFRLYLKARDLKASQQNWRQLVVQMMNDELDPGLRLVAALEADTSFDMRKAPVKARFAEYTKQAKEAGLAWSKQTYHRRKAELATMCTPADRERARKIKFRPGGRDARLLAMQEAFRRQEELLKAAAERPGDTAVPAAPHAAESCPGGQPDSAATLNRLEEIFAQALDPGSPESAEAQMLLRRLQQEHHNLHDTDGPEADRSSAS